MKVPQLRPPVNQTENPAVLAVPEAEVAAGPEEGAVVADAVETVGAGAKSPAGHRPVPNL
jgi:hypothetical protein